MEHNLLPGCILSCKEISAQSHYRKSKRTHLSRITPCFTDRKHRQRNSSQCRARAEQKIREPQPCSVSRPLDPTASRFSPDFKGYGPFISRESPFIKLVIAHMCVEPLHQRALAWEEQSVLSSAPAICSQTLSKSGHWASSNQTFPHPQKKAGILDQLLPSKPPR